MYYVYILKSSVAKTIYIGYSSDLRRRISEHQQGKVYYTRRYRPWNLIYYEAYSDELSAKQRERNLKDYGSSYVGLLKRLGLR